MTETSLLPPFPKFDNTVETWSTYKDRMYYYFLAHKITEDGEKLPLFLSGVNPTIFSLLQNLLAPKKITDAALTFKQIETLLDKHFDESANILASTYEFYSCRQKPGQNAADWIAILRSKARLCGFSNSILKDKPTDRALRDMLVLGKADVKARQELLKAGDPSLEDAEKIIRMAEQLRGDISKFDKPSQQVEVAKINYEKNGFQRRNHNKGKNLSKKGTGR